MYFYIVCRTALNRAHTTTRRTIRTLFLLPDTIPHPKMDWSHPDRPQAYKEFKQTSNMWFQVKGITPDKRHNYIILWAGREGLRIFNTSQMSNSLIPKTYGISFRSMYSHMKTLGYTGLNFSNTNRPIRSQWMTFIRDARQRPWIVNSRKMLLLRNTS